jgi:hypothetical protein
VEGRGVGGVGHGDAENLADGGAGAGGVLGFDFADGGFGAVDLVAGGDFEGAGPAEVGGNTEAIGVIDDGAGGGRLRLWIQSVPGSALTKDSSEGSSLD